MIQKNGLLTTAKYGPEVKSRILASVYSIVLSWPDAHETKHEPATDDLGGDLVAGSTSEQPESHPYPLHGKAVEGYGEGGNSP
jgi:hypothetical protein